MYLIKFSDKKCHLESLINTGETFFNEVQNYTESNESERGAIKYIDLSKKGKYELTPFEKKIEHEHQNEYRVIIKNLNDKPEIIHIGSIAQYCVLVDSKSMVETIWEAKRKTTN